MSCREWLEARTAGLSATDVVLLKWSCVAAGIWLAQSLPALRRVDRRLVAVACLALAAKPAMTVLGGPGGCCAPAGTERP